MLHRKLVPLLGAWLCLSLALASPRSAARADDDDAPAAAWRTACDQFLQDLLRLAQDCHDRKLFGVRDELYLRVLGLDPEQPTALKRLKYVRQKDGSWLPPPRFKPSPNLARTGLDEANAETQLAADALAQRAAALRERSDARLAASILVDLLRLAPDSAVTRGLNDELRDPEDPSRWVLAETPRARERRRALERSARDALSAAAQPVEDRPSAEEARLKVPWAAVLNGPKVRLLGTVPEDELRQESRLAEAASVLFAFATKQDAPAFKQLRLLVLDDVRWRDPVVDGWPHTQAKEKEYVSRLQSFWLSKSETLVIVSTDANRRREWAARQPLQALLRRAYGLDSQRGWAYEGVALYLGWTLSGERQTYMVRREGYAEQQQAEQDALWSRLAAADSDWFAEAHTVLSRMRPGDLSLTLGKTVSTMDGADRLVGFALAAYLLEARPDEGVQWLVALKEGDATLENTLLETLRLTPELLLIRLVRWLRERTVPG